MTPHHHQVHHREAPLTPGIAIVLAVCNLLNWLWSSQKEKESLFHKVAVWQMTGKKGKETFHVQNL